MRKASQNKGDSRPLTENFSPQGKVKDILLQQPPQPPSTSVLQEIPMKSSQIPYWHPYTSSRQDKNNCSPSSYTRRNHETKSTVILSSSGSRNATEQRHNSKNQQQEQTPSKEKPFPDKHSSKRRHRESDHNTKKPCLQTINSDSAPKSTAGLELTPLPGPRSSMWPSLSPKTTENNLCNEATSTKSGYFKMPPQLKPVSSSCTSPVHRPSLTAEPSQGAKKVCVKSIKNNIVTLASSSNARNDCSAKKDSGSSLLSCKVQHKGNVHSGHRNAGSSSGVPVKDLSRVSQVAESRRPGLNIPRSSQKKSSGSSSSRKSSHLRRPVIIDDIDQIFTPDPISYIVNNGQETVKPRTDSTTKSHTSEKRCSSDTVTSSRSPRTGSLCAKNQSPARTESPHPAQTKVPSVGHMQLSIPTVALVRVNLENMPLPSTHSAHNHPVDSTEKPVNEEFSKINHKSLTPKNVVACTAEKDATSPSPCSLSAVREDGQRGEGDGQSMNDEDSSLDLDLNSELGVDDTQSSDSSEDEQLVSLQELMAHVTNSPNSPEKGDFSHRKNKPSVSKTNTNIYKNNLDQMMTEIMNHKKAKEVETQLLTACTDLLTIAENEEAKENRDEAMFAEQQQFLQRYSQVSSTIRDMPPGEVVFNLDHFGYIFNSDSLQLRQFMFNPQEMAQKSLLWSSQAQLRLHINIGLFQEAYNCHSPCPFQITRFLFKMMSVHSERILCEKILQALCDIAYSAASQIVENGGHQFEVWVPSLADVTLVLMNMGVPFVTLFSLKNLQPAFTEGDLLEDVCIKSEGSSGQKEESIFPEHNCNNIFKYLSYCMSLCPRAYSDYELLLLLTLLGRISLETRLIYQYSVEMYPLQYKIVNNIRDWDSMMCSICLAFTDLTNDHHNMCLLVQMLPDNMRGRQLRHHLSLCMISKLLDGNCTYTPQNKEFQLADLRLYLPRMQPSSVLQSLTNSSSRTRGEEEDTASLDQQAYYLCHSLLTLANEASNIQVLPAHQKEQLLLLCSELATHIKCDIRESKTCLYRTKVKDLVARIDTKWQMLLLKTRPLNGKLWDYWQPSARRISQGTDESLTSDDGESALTEKESVNDENEVEEDEEENEEMGEDRGESKTEGGAREPQTEKESEDAIDDTTVAVAEPLTQNSQHKITAMEVCNRTEVSDEQSQADGMELGE